MMMKNPTYSLRRRERRHADIEQRVFSRQNIQRGIIRCQRERYDICYYVLYDLVVDRGRVLREVVYHVKHIYNASAPLCPKRDGSRNGLYARVDQRGERYYQNRKQYL